MPDIDVSDLLLDGDIAGESFVVVRRQETVGANGVAVLQTTTLPAAGQPPIVGSIFPTGDNSLVRQEAFSQQQAAVTVVTPFRLRPASKDALGNSYQADLIYWSGTYYIVKSLKPWTSYGAGFVEAECVAFDLNVRAPGEIPVPGSLDFSNPDNAVLEPTVIR